jgi:DNA-binding NarL/FixJ family response regulator
MPNVDGLKACRQITQAIPETKVIVLTAMSNAAIRQQALTAGASAFIAKQEIAEELLAAITRVCANRCG